MARLYFCDKPDFVHLYSGDKSVGRGGVNAREDVLLVQFFLRVVMEDSPKSEGYRPPNETPITIDGNCGPQTIRYILYFQQEGNRRNPDGQTTVDGVIDPVVGAKLIGSISGTFYTILALNANYRHRRPGMLNDIRKDVLCPPELANALTI